MFVGGLFQFNSGSSSLSSNVRFRWEYEPGSDLFVVYSDGRDTELGGFPRLVNRTFAIKLTTAVILPPTLSPAIASLDASTPNSSAFSATYLVTA